MNWRRWVCFVAVLAVLGGRGCHPGRCGGEAQASAPTQVMYPTKMDVSPELRTIAPKTTQAGELKVVPNKPDADACRC